MTISEFIIVYVVVVYLFTIILIIDAQFKNYIEPMDYLAALIAPLLPFIGLGIIINDCRRTSIEKKRAAKYWSEL